MIMSQKMMNPNSSAIQWLRHSKDPSIRFFTLTELVQEPEDLEEVKSAKAEISESPKVQNLLRGQEADGGFGVHAYTKWTGAHWRLVSVVELGVSSNNKIVRKAVESVLAWIATRAQPPKIEGLWRAHASIDGNVLGVCSRLGLARDSRVQQICDRLIEWQWPDGGWNCDSNKNATHSSFYESLATLWGLNEYSRATKDKEARNSVRKASEFFLRHHLFKSCSTGKVINPEWLKLHYPLYWHYDILQSLRVIQLAGRLGDSRTKQALDILESKRLKDGRWRPSGYYWFPSRRAVDGKRVYAEVVDWGRNGPNEMISLNALRVLKGGTRFTAWTEEFPQKYS